MGHEGNLRQDGTFEYYISEPIFENDAIGIAPFIMAYVEKIRKWKPELTLVFYLFSTFNRVITRLLQLLCDKIAFININCVLLIKILKY